MKIKNVQLARESMSKELRNRSLRQTYIANIAMCIYDNRDHSGRYNLWRCNDVAEKLLKLIFEG